MGEQQTHDEPGCGRRCCKSVGDMLLPGLGHSPEDVADAWYLSQMELCGMLHVTVLVIHLKHTDPVSLEEQDVG